MTNRARPESTLCDSAAVEPVDITPRAQELAAALAADSIERIQGLSAADFWERVGEADYAERLPVGGAVELLGTLNDRSLLLVTPDAGLDGRYALEQAWSDASPPLVADEREFSLVDAARLRAQGDDETLARMATKIACQDAAEALCAALAARDVAAVRAMVEPGKDELADREAARAAEATRAELVGSVGPRTLVRVWSAAGDVTLEYLWRRHDDVWQIAMVREFGRAG